MNTTLIVGAGVMGTAFCVPLAESDSRVMLAGTHLDEPVIQAMRAGRPHPRLGVKVPDGVELFCSHEMKDAFARRPELVVLGVSSPGVEWAIEKLVEHLHSPAAILLLTKGLSSADGRIVTLPQVVASQIEARKGWQPGAVAAGGVGGPCIAGELAVRRDTTVVFGVPESMQPLLEERIRADFYRIRYSTDVTGVEACAALKNFLAIGVSTAAGASERGRPAENGAAAFNPEAALFTSAAEELADLTVALGGRRETALGPAGLGDLYVTCRAGRNSRFGRLLGGGLTAAEASERMAGETVEGLDLALAIGPALRAMMGSGDIDRSRLRLTRSLLDALCDGGQFEYGADAQ